MCMEVWQDVTNVSYNIQWNYATLVLCNDCSMQLAAIGYFCNIIYTQNYDIFINNIIIIVIAFF